VRVTLQRAYKFRLYPTLAQVAELAEWERQLRRLYNVAHEQRLHSLGRPLRPKSPGIDECRSCGATKSDETEHVAACAGGGYAGGECRGCGAKLHLVTHHTAACAFVDYYRQNREQTALLADDKLTRVVWSARQEVLRDLEKAWQRWRKGLGGKPHFKRRTDRCRIYFASPSQWRVAAGGGPGYLNASKWSTLTFSGMAASVGSIRIRQDRSWPEDAKFSSCHITRDVSEWYAVFPLAFARDVTTPKGGAVGINRGAVHAIADSRGRLVDSPRYYARSLRVVQRRSRQLARKLAFGKRSAAPPVKYRGLDPETVNALARELGTTPGKVVYEARRRGGLDAAAAHLRLEPPAPKREALAIPSEGRNRERARLRLAIAHQVIRRRREKFLHTESAYYAQNFARVGIERWSTRAMTSSEPEPATLVDESSTTETERAPDRAPFKRRRSKRALNRSILDVGWYEFARQLKYKSPAAGGEVTEVDPGLAMTEALPELVASAALRAQEGDGMTVDPSLLAGTAGISRTCSGCGARLREAASGRREALCDVCLKLEPGDVNAAKNVLLRMLLPPEDSKPLPAKRKVTIGINGKRRRAA
jgi:transposase